MSPLQDPEDLHEATQIVNLYAASDWLTLSMSMHARQQMEKRIVPHDVMVTTLKVGQCVGFRKEHKGCAVRYSYEIEMTDQYGRVTVVTAVPGLHKLHIVTVYTDIPD